MGASAGYTDLHATTLFFSLLFCLPHPPRSVVSSYRLHAAGAIQQLSQYQAPAGRVPARLGRAGVEGKPANQESVCRTSTTGEQDTVE